MVLENVSISFLTWIIVATLVLIVLASVGLRISRFRKFKLFPVSELRFLIRFTRIIAFIFFVIVFMEFISGVVFGRGLIDTAIVSLSWYFNKVSFLVALSILMFVPRYLFSISRTRDVVSLKSDIKIDNTTSTKLIDSVDWDILSAIKKYGGDLEIIKNELKWIDETELENKINKLHLLGYVKMDGYDLHLTSDALDVLNLPPVLFASTINDKNVIKKLAEIKIVLKKEDANGVINECSKLLEWVLKKKIKNRLPDKEKVKSGKSVEMATLGELIGDCRADGIINKFEDNILTAINDVRKNVHSVDNKMTSLSLEKAYFVHSLTEIAIRSLYSQEI